MSDKINGFEMYMYCRMCEELSVTLKKWTPGSWAYFSVACTKIRSVMLRRLQYVWTTCRLHLGSLVLKFRAYFRYSSYEFQIAFVTHSSG
jgi:hypothetical protein